MTFYYEFTLEDDEKRFVDENEAVLAVGLNDKTRAAATGAKTWFQGLSLWIRVLVWTLLATFFLVAIPIAVYAGVYLLRDGKVRLKLLMIAIFAACIFILHWFVLDPTVDGSSM